MRIMLVEDDAPLGNAVKLALHDASYAVDWVQDGESALRAIELEEYALILLDLGLPKKDGLEVLRELRKDKNKLPVIIITARDAVEDRIRGLDYGADDYLVKPFSIDELHARIRAVIRRNHGVADPVLSNNIITLNPVNREVSRNDQTFQLTAKEYALLHALMLRLGAILSREKLEESIYGWNEEVASNAIEFIIHALRKKLGKDVIKNVRGMGWMVSK
ncbi:MAG: DNA-binding response regulator [Thalassobium sp.]|uniref:Two component transcriptional regulator, winged helix family n=2 Tax=root TaxID=1 RepID=M5E4B5_9GAMM|nr:DNA-binding response regulator [Thalassolituus oleivorans]PCI48160.1 MAG: DNA-binding response regulator [Oceanospirillales bacterium]PHQ88340.1 MAG: DNA-binding response regulator [Thalassobium sp.]CCU72344.1 two component transcriptional regulator, winged helix family [Thalassolituus oleivorans MIL-1]